MVKNQETSYSLSKQSSSLHPSLKENQDLNSIHLTLLMNDKKHKEFMRQNIERQKRLAESIRRENEVKEEKRIFDLQNFKNEKKQAYMKFMKGVETDNSQKLTKNESTAKKTIEYERSRTIAPLINEKKSHISVKNPIISEFISKPYSQAEIQNTYHNIAEKELIQNQSNNNKTTSIPIKTSFLLPQNNLLEERNRLRRKKEDILYEQNIEKELEKILMEESNSEFFPKKQEEEKKKVINQSKPLKKNNFPNVPLKIIESTENEMRMTESIYKDFLEKEAQNAEYFNQIEEKRVHLPSINNSKQTQKGYRIKKMAKLNPIEQHPVSNVIEIAERNRQIELDDMERKLQESILRLEKNFQMNPKTQFSAGRSDFSRQNQGYQVSQMRSEKEVLESIDNLNSRLENRQTTVNDYSNVSKKSVSMNKFQNMSRIQHLNNDAKKGGEGKSNCQSISNFQSTKSNFQGELQNPIWSLPETVSFTTNNESTNNEKYCFDRKRGENTYAERNLKKMNVCKKVDAKIETVKKSEFETNKDKNHKISFKPELVRDLFR